MQPERSMPYFPRYFLHRKLNACSCLQKDGRCSDDCDSRDSSSAQRPQSRSSSLAVLESYSGTSQEDVAAYVRKLDVMYAGRDVELEYLRSHSADDGTASSTRNTEARSNTKVESSPSLVPTVSPTKDVSHRLPRSLKHAVKAVCRKTVSQIFCTQPSRRATEEPLNCVSNAQLRKKLRHRRGFSVAATSESSFRYDSSSAIRHVASLPRLHAPAAVEETRIHQRFEHPPQVVHRIKRVPVPKE